jgi:undecaprenyl diphosphate synthase
MDGNGRWAKKRFLPRVAGHRAGAESVRRVVEAAPDLGIEVVTLYAFSSENWKRPEDEVSALQALLRTYLQNEIDELDAKGVRLKFIGDYSRFGPDLATLIEGAARRTAGNAKLTLVIALNYGSQQEIARAAASLAAESLPITPEAIEARLETADLPLPDLVIRTSGEQRLSNFMLWQSAYAELIFTEELWPDFDGKSLARAVADFAGRERRFGGL